MAMLERIDSFCLPAVEVGDDVGESKEDEDEFDDGSRRSFRFFLGEIMESFCFLGDVIIVLVVVGIGKLGMYKL